jgi:hypothetical protein
MITKQILKIQPTKENPIIIENYPYGFKRTKIKYWVESVKNKGDRFISQTLNPKTQLWNKPKKATYNPINIVYENEKGHITYFPLSSITGKDSYNKFLEFIGNLELNELQKDQLRQLRAFCKAYENVSYEIRRKKFKNKITGEIVEQVPLCGLNNFEEIVNEEREEEQKEVKENINKSIGYNYHKNEKGVLN